MAHFQDADGGFFFTADDHEQLIVRSKDMADSSVPSGNAMAANGLLTLARLTGRKDFQDAAESALLAASGVMASSPQAAGQASTGSASFARAGSGMGTRFGRQHAAATSPGPFVALQA